MKTTMRDKVCQLIGKYHALEEYFYNKAFLKASIGSDLAGFYSFYSKSVESEQADMCGQFLADLNKLLEEDEAPADPRKTAPVDARNVAVQRLIDETGHGLDVYEVTDVCEVKE